ncbi:cyclic nucleotide-gated ion channel [Aureococcus anophagefferens]|nr:cyclic nucleotide-gated ion channel [Aureococcus anophagefferens]
MEEPVDLSAAAEAAGLPIVEEVAAPAPAPESAAGGRVTDEELAAYGNESRPTDTSEEGGSRTAATSRPSTGTSRADGSVASGAAAGLSDEELGAFLAATPRRGQAARSSSPASDAELDAYIAAGTSESSRATLRRPRPPGTTSRRTVPAELAQQPERLQPDAVVLVALREKELLEERPPSSELSNPLELAKAVPEDQEQGSWSPPPAGDGRGDLLRSNALARPTGRHRRRRAGGGAREAAADGVGPAAEPERAARVLGARRVAHARTSIGASLGRRLSLRNVVSTVIDGLGQDGASPRTQRGSKDSVASLEGDDGEGKSPTKRPNRLIRQLTMRTLAKRKSRDLTGEGDSPKSPEKPEEKKNLGRMLMSAEKFEKIMQSQKLGRDHESMVNQFKLRTTPTAQQGDSSWINRALSSSKHVRVLAPRGERGESGWSHAGRVALILATLAEERDFLRDKSEEDAPRQLREQAILAFLRATCPALVAKVETHHEIADELVALRAALEDRGVFSVSTGEQHLFQCGTLEEVRAEIERLEAAEKREGWKQAVPRCMMRNWKTSTPTKEARSGARPDDGTWASLSDAVLDPDGAIARSWGALIVAAVVGQVVVVPFCLSFRAWRAFAPLAWATDALFALDVGVQLRTAFHRQVAGDAAAAAAEAQVTRSAVEWSLRRIRENYARRCLAVDAAALAPGLAAAPAAGRVAPARSALRLAKVLKTFAAFKADTGPGRSRFRDTPSSPSTATLNVLLLLFVLMVIMHATACAWHGVTTREHWERRVEAVNEHAREDFGDDAEDAGAGEVRYGNTSRRWLYIMALYESVLILMGEDIDISAERELAFAIVAIIICAVLLAIVFGQVSVLISNMNERPQAYRKKLAKLDDAMRQDNLPEVLQDRILAYYKWLWEEHNTLDGRVKIALFLPELSPNLAKEVRLFWCRDMILNVPFFRLFPSQVVQRLVCAVRVEFYMPDDYIILVGEFGHEMFFIKSGTVDVFRVDEAEVQVTRDAKLKSRGAAKPDDEKRQTFGDKLFERLRRNSKGESEEAKAAAAAALKAAGGAAHAPGLTAKPKRRLSRASRHGFLRNKKVSPGSPPAEEAKEPAEPASPASPLSDPESPSTRTEKIQREQIVCSLQEGEYFGDVALLTKSQRTATIKARTFVTCAIISRDQFEGLLADHPEAWEKSMTILRDKYKLGPQATRAEELQHEVVAKAFADAETKRKQTLEGGGTEADVSKRLVKLQQMLAQLEADLPDQIDRLVDAARAGDAGASAEAPRRASTGASDNL